MNLAQFLLYLGCLNNMIYIIYHNEGILVMKIDYLNKYVTRYKKQFFIALSFLILETMGDLIQPTIMSKIIDNGVKRGDMNYVLKLAGIHVVKAFNNEEKVINEFKAQNDILRDVGVKAQIWSGFIMPLMNVIGNFGFGVIAVFGGSLAVKGIISVGVIASFTSYSKRFTRPLHELANTFNTLQSGIAGAERVFEILDEVEERKDSCNAIVNENIMGEVEFKNVTFEYKKDEPVLKNISFKVSPGTNIALVGPTGAGKTTIVNLLTGFYEINKGEILIDGINIKDYKKNSLRKIF